MLRDTGLNTLRNMFFDHWIVSNDYGDMTRHTQRHVSAEVDSLLPAFNSIGILLSYTFSSSAGGLVVPVILPQQHKHNV